MNKIDENFEHIGLAIKQYHLETCPYRKVRSGIDVVNLMIKTMSCCILGEWSLLPSWEDEKKNLTFLQAGILSMGSWAKIIHLQKKYRGSICNFTTGVYRYIENFVFFRNLYVSKPITSLENCRLPLLEIENIINALVSIPFFQETRILIVQNVELNPDNLWKLMLDLKFDHINELNHDLANIRLQLPDGQLIPVAHPSTLV